jgi:hypothetical protein
MDPVALQILHHVLDARRRGASERVSLPGMDLRGAQLMRADLVGADLSGAGLDHAQLAGAKLGNATLEGTLFRHADLAGADLTGADLRQADLSDARLEGASLAGADLRGACVTGVMGEPASVAGARIDRAMCLRSKLADEDVVRLSASGAVIEDVASFDSPLIRAACSSPEEGVASDAGPPTRRVSHIEVEARRQRLLEDDEMAPSARATDEMVRLVALPEKGAGPMSLRSLKLVAEVLTPDMVRAPAWKSGDSVMGVALDEVIGEGPSAIVWRGTDGSGDAVAVKLFKAPRASVGLSLPSFRRGVAVMNRLTSSLDAGVTKLRAVSLNRLGFVSDLAANGSATDLPALRWNVKSAVKFFDGLCRTVRAAHGEGALHRCLKPSNVLLDEDLEPMLCDFDMVDLPTLAAESRDVGGYARYAAPEELLGLGTQSPTADVYSLGRILHFLLLGAPPAAFAGPAPTLAELKEQPAGLVRIVRKCTMRAPEARYQQVEELLDDLANYEDHERVGIGGGPEANYLPYRVSSLSHRTPWLGEREGRAEPRHQQRGDDREAPAGAKPLGLSRNGEKAVGAIGALLVLASMVVIMTVAHPASSLLWQMRALSAVGGAGMSLLMPRAGSNGTMWRLIWLALAAGGLFMADLPGLAAPTKLPPGISTQPSRR